MNACSRRASTAASSTTSASTSRKRTWSRNPDAFITRSTRAAGAVRWPCGDSRPGGTGCATISTTGNSARIAGAAAPGARLRAFPGSRGDTALMMQEANERGLLVEERPRRMRKLELRSVNVLTNALNIAALLIDVPAVRLIMPGGILRRESNSLSGHMAEAALANLQADRLYLGADGVDPELGVMTPHLAEAELNAKMIRISRQVVVVAYSSKFMRRNISLIAKVEQLHLLITDRAAPVAAIEELRRRGGEVQLV